MIKTKVGVDNRDENKNARQGLPPGFVQPGLCSRVSQMSSEEADYACSEVEKQPCSTN